MFISHIPVLNFAGTTRNRLHHACVPTWTNIPKTHHKTSDPKMFISHICFELCRNSSPCYTTHVSQPILNQRPKTHYKLQIRKFSSHTSLFWILPEQITPHMCANPQPMFQRYTTKPQTPRCSSHTSVFWALPEQLAFYTTHVCQPRTNVPKIHHKTSERKIFISHICFELCRSSSPCYTTHVSHPILNQRPKTHYKLQIRKFSSHTSLFWTLPEQITRMCANPEPTFQTYTTKPQTQRFSSHTSLFWTLPEQLSILHHTCGPTHREPTSQETLQTSDPNFVISHICFELCRNSSPCCTTHVSQPILNQRPKTHHKTSDPKIFISHIHLLNFAGAALHIAPHMWANPSWTNVPRHTTNFRSDFFHLTHPCFELCRNSSPCYTTHVSQPILYQRPKIHHKPLMTQFCKPILIQPPKIHLSKFPCSLIGGKNVEPCKKTRSNENLCATFRPKMVLSKLQWLKLPAPNLLQKCSQEVFPQLKSFGFMVIWSQNSKICKKGPKAKKLRPNILDAKFGWNLAKKPGSSSWFSARSPKRGLKFEIRIKKLPRLWLSSFASDREVGLHGAAAAFVCFRAIGKKSQAGAGLPGFWGVGRGRLHSPRGRLDGNLPGGSARHIPGRRLLHGSWTGSTSYYIYARWLVVVLAAARERSQEKDLGAKLVPSYFVCLCFVLGAKILRGFWM